MRHSLLKLAAAVAALGLSAACMFFPNPEGEPGWRMTPERETVAPTGTELRERIDFRAGGTLSLENDYGDVEITGWDRDSVDVAVTAAQAETESPRSARIARVRKDKPAVEIRETDEGLLIRTRTFEGPGDPPEASYKVRVPNSVNLAGIRISEGDLAVSGIYGRLEASLDKGNLEVQNFSGSINASVGTGDADVEVLDLRETDSITIISRKGNIVLRLESGVGAIVEADAPRAGVRSDFELGVKLPAPTVKGWIGQGGPNIILRASDGRIDILSVRSETAAAGATKEK
jgi:hypothetical protein